MSDITKMAFFAPDPKLMTVNMDDLAKRQKEIIKAREAQPVRSEGPAEELRKLKNKLWELTQRAKDHEIYCNNKAGEVKLLDLNITHAINQKKAYVASGNALAERHCEHTIARLETERTALLREFNRAREQAANSAAALKSWPNRERITELETSLAG